MVMEIGRQFALFGPSRSIPRRVPNWAPEIDATPKDTPTQAWRGYNNPQLPMFLTAREIKHNYQPHYGDRMEDPYNYETGKETDSILWERKAMEAHENGLTRHLRDHKWQFDQAIPLSMHGPAFGRAFMPFVPLDSETGGPMDTRPEILDGHHRIAAADDTDYGGSPDALIPVVHVPPHEVLDHTGRSSPTL